MAGGASIPGHHATARVERRGAAPSRSRRPRDSGGGAARSTLYGAEHRCMLAGVMTTTIPVGHSSSNAAARASNEQ